MHEDISADAIRVIGISPQDENSHTRFRQKHRLPFTLLADTDKSVVRAFGADGPLGIGVRRATFLIDSDQTVRDVVVADVRIGRHTEFIREAVQRRRT